MKLFSYWRHQVISRVQTLQHQLHHSDKSSPPGWMDFSFIAVMQELPVSIRTVECVMCAVWLVYKTSRSSSSLYKHRALHDTGCFRRVWEHVEIPRSAGGMLQAVRTVCVWGNNNFLFCQHVLCCLWSLTVYSSVLDVIGELNITVHYCSVKKFRWLVLMNFFTSAKEVVEVLWCPACNSLLLVYVTNTVDDLLILYMSTVS